MTQRSCSSVLNIIFFRDLADANSVVLNPISLDDAASVYSHGTCRSQRTVSSGSYMPRFSAVPFANDNNSVFNSSDVNKRVSVHKQKRRGTSSSSGLSIVDQNQKQEADPPSYEEVLKCGNKYRYSYRGVPRPYSEDQSITTEPPADYDHKDVMSGNSSNSHVRPETPSWVNDIYRFGRLEDNSINRFGRLEDNTSNREYRGYMTCCGNCPRNRWTNIITTFICFCPFSPIVFYLENKADNSSHLDDRARNRLRKNSDWLTMWSITIFVIGGIAVCLLRRW